MPIAKEILSMFEFNQNSKIALSIDNHFDECTLSQHRSVPTEQKKLSMHRYLHIISHRKTFVALWVHPYIVIIMLCYVMQWKQESLDRLVEKGLSHRILTPEIV